MKKNYLISSLGVSLLTLLISCSQQNPIDTSLISSENQIETFSEFSLNQSNQNNYKKVQNLSNYQELLTKWDTDTSDKGLTVKEIKNAVDKNTDGNVTLDELQVSGLNQEDSNLVLQRLKEIPVKNNEIAYKLVELDSRVFPGGITKITESDIQQGKRNVCYFLSGLAGLAYNRRYNDIVNLMDKNRDGTFTVTFPGIKGTNKFTVNFPTNEDLSKLIFSGKNGSAWVAIAVNAYHQYGMKGRPFKHIFAKDYVSDYGLTWEGIEVQNAHRADSYLLDFYKNEKLFASVKSALDSKRIVTVCTFLKGNIASPTNPKKNEYKFSKAHILTLTNVDAQKQTVTIRDPYGQYEFYDENGKVQVNKSTDGFITLPVDLLKKYFLDISIETNDKWTFKGIRDILNRFL